MIRATATTDATSRNQIGQPAAWMIANTRQIRCKTKLGTLAARGAFGKESMERMDAVRVAPLARCEPVFRYPQLLWIRL
jgi:hypothetical protein